MANNTDPIQATIDVLNKDIAQLVKRRDALVVQLQQLQEEGDRIHEEAKTLGHVEPEQPKSAEEKIAELQKQIAELKRKKK